MTPDFYGRFISTDYAVFSKTVIVGLIKGFYCITAIEAQNDGCGSEQFPILRPCHVKKIDLLLYHEHYFSYFFLLHDFLI